MDNVNTLQEYIDAKNNLESVLRRPGRFSTEEETKVLQTFYSATSKPSEVENIKNALDAANSLPDSNEIKVVLIDTINKLANHYNPQAESAQIIENSENSIEEIAKIRAAEFSSMVGYPDDAYEIEVAKVFFKWAENPQEENLNELTKYTSELPEESRLREFLLDTLKMIEEKQTPIKETTEEVTTETEIKSEKLTELEAEKEKLLRMLTVIDSYEKGLFDDQRKKTKSFEDRKKELEDKISEIESLTTEEDIVDIKEEFRLAETKLKTYASRTGKDQLPPMRFYEAAAGIPFSNNIIPALEKAAALSDDDELKPMLIDALVKLDARYPDFKDEEDAKKVAEKMAELGIKPYTPEKKINPEVLKLKEEIAQLEEEQKRRIEEEKTIKENINKRIIEIEKEIEEEKNRILQEKSSIAAEVEQVQQTENNTGEAEPLYAIPPIEEPEPSFSEKLSQIAEEGPIFVDTEGRVKEKDQWLTASNASNLGKLLPESEIAETPTLNNEADSLTKPHIIKSAKKVGIKLIEKVKSIDFSKKLKESLEWIKKHKVAVAIGLFTLGIATYGASYPNEMTNENNTEISQENQTDEEELKQEESQQENITVEKTEAELAQEAIQNALNGVLAGDSVYGNAIDAANETNPRNTTESMREKSWANAEAGKFYEVDQNAEVLTQEQAEAKIAAGEEVVIRYDNNGVPIGYVPVSKQSTDQTGLSK